MAHILVAFFNGVKDEENPNAIPIFYESFVNGLDKAGNNVYMISHGFFRVNFGVIDDEIRQQIIDFNPDICFLFNNCFYDLSDVVDCPIVIYEADSPVFFSNKEVLRKNPDRFLYFVISTDSVEIIQKEYGVSREKIFHVPLFTEVYADDTVEPTANISFIGSKFIICDPEILPNVFCKRQPERWERDLYLKCIEVIKREPQISVKDLIHRLLILSQKVGLHLAIPEILTFLSNEKRIHILSALVDLGLELYGTKNWAEDYYYDYRLNLAFNDKRVYSLKQNQDIYNSSKIGISISHAQAVSGFPWRVMDIMASNACLVTDYHTDFEELFKGVKIPAYTSEYEAREICQELLHDESRRKEIVLQCQEVIGSKYRFRHLLKRMEEYTGVKMHVQGEGGGER